MKTKAVKKTYIIRYFWDNNFHTVNVKADSSIDAKLIALQKVRVERNHHPYTLDVIQVEV